MEIIKVETKEEAEELISRIRSTTSIPEEISDKVGEIIEGVRSRGDAALLEYTSEFDGADLGGSGIEVSAQYIQTCWEEVEFNLGKDLLHMAGRIESFASRSLPEDWLQEFEDGLALGQVYRPLTRVGIYVPGGRYPYLSTALMAGIPATVAGVKEICFCTPPGDDGEIPKEVLAAAYLVKGARVFRCGGAQAIAAMSFGTKTVPRVDRLYGPGNIYVVAAKRALSHVTDQGLEAGPSEVAIVLDESCNPTFAACDLLAQTEHDPLSVGVVISMSRSVLENVKLEIEMLDSEHKDACENIWAVQVADKGMATDFVNMLAPEHLEMLTDKPEGWLEGIKSAGAIFLGQYSPAVLGDYVAGPSHVLPTGGRAQSSSGLNVLDYFKIINVVKYTKEGFQMDQEIAMRMARVEGLVWHSRTLEIRAESENDD